MGQSSLRKGSLGKIAAFLLALVAGYVVWVAAWARQGTALQPVRLDRDSCAHCGMVISDLRFAVSVLSQDEQGHVITLHFDDPGCFLAYAHAHPQAAWNGVGHDYETSREIPLNKIVFKKTDIATPMGTGWITLKQGAGVSLREALK